MSDAIIILEGSEPWIAMRRDHYRAQAEDWILLRRDERQAGQVYQELRSYSFFGTARTVFVEGVDDFTKDDLQELGEALKALAPKTMAILSCAPKNAAALQKAMPEGVRARVEAEQNTPVASAAAVSKTLDLQLDPDLKVLLDQAFGGDPLRLTRELEKLSLLKPDGKVSVDDWRGVSAEPGVVDGWRFARAVMARDLVTADRTLKTWVDEGGGSHSAGRDLLGAVSYVLRQYMLFKVAVARGQSPGEAARSVPGRFIPEDQRYAASWSLQQLGNALSELVVLDRGLKSSSLPAEMQLFRWCVAVAQ